MQSTAEDSPRHCEIAVAPTQTNNPTYHVRMEFSFDRNAIRAHGIASGINTCRRKTPAAMRPETSATVNSIGRTNFFNVETEKQRRARAPL